MPEFATIGKRIRRLDSLAKATSEAGYTADLKWTGMLHGTLLRSPYPHARITGIDCSGANALPGVKAVLTAADTPGKKFGICVRDEHPIAVDRVRYVGDEVAAQ